MQKKYKSVGVGEISESEEQKNLVHVAILVSGPYLPFNVSCILL